MKKLIIKTWNNKEYSPKEGLTKEYFTGILYNEKLEPLVDVGADTEQEVIDKLTELAKNEYYPGEEIIISK